MHLGSCEVGQDVEVREVSAPPSARLRMREVGLRAGAVVRITQRGPFGGRVVAVGGSRIALDAATAAAILVEPWHDPETLAVHATAEQELAVRP